MKIDNHTKKRLLIFILLSLILSIIIIFYERNLYETHKNKMVEKAISLINQEFSDFNIDQDSIVVENKEDIDIELYTCLMTSKKDMSYDDYMRIGNVKTENNETDEHYVEFLYNNELDQIVAYNILQSNTNKSPYTAIEE